MNKIKVPCMPVDKFDSSKFAEKFSEPSQEEINEIIKMNSKCSDGEESSQNIELILQGIGMEKYIKLFQKEKVLLETFLQLNESDLEEIGITNEEDRKFIAKNLSFHNTSTNNFIVSENHIEDLQIIKNISHQLLLLENYCTYLNMQMKKQKLMDYRINTKESACTYLKAFAECALIQSQIMRVRIYDVNGSEALINKLLKANNLTLPKALQELLPKKKKKRIPAYVSCQRELRTFITECSRNMCFLKRRRFIRKDYISYFSNLTSIYCSVANIKFQALETEIIKMYCGRHYRLLSLNYLQDSIINVCTEMIG